MTHDKYLVAGVARNSVGTLKARYSTLSVKDTIDRQEKAGNTDILYVELPTAMSREEIPAYLLTLEAFNSVPDFKAILEEANTNHALKAKTPRVKPAKVNTLKPVRAKPAKSTKPVKVADLEEDTDLEIEELKALIS